MGLKFSICGRASRFSTYIEAMTSALGHADRAAPFQSYCAGLLLAGDRKSVEPIAARVQPGRVWPRTSRCIISWKAKWSDEAVLAAVRAGVLAVIEKHGLLRAPIIDDTGMPKKGSPLGRRGTAILRPTRQEDNCQIAVSLLATNNHASLPIAYRLYLPQDWAQDPERRARADVDPDFWCAFGDSNVGVIGDKPRNTR